MNYKLSKREEFLLKSLGIIGLVAFVDFIETKLIDGINQSRNNLFQSLDKFNQTKQSLAQLKDYEQNEEQRMSPTSFQLSYETDGVSLSIALDD